MTTATVEIEPDTTNGSVHTETVSLDSNPISSDDQLSQIIESIDLSTTDGDQTTDGLTSKPSTRTAGQSTIGAKLVQKLENFAASSKEHNQSNGKNAPLPSTIDATSTSVPTNSKTTNATTNNDSESRRVIAKAARNIVKNLNDSDPQKNLLVLATKIIELQEQSRMTQTKVSDLEKRSTTIMRERDQVLLENGRIVAAKTKLESLCRELNRHNQQIRDDSTQRQREDETKRQELAAKFQTTIEEIALQLSNYSEKSTSLREQNIQLSEQLATVVRDYDLREKEIETALKKRELELRLTEVSLEQSHSLLTERTELIKQEREVSEAERLILYKKCEELAASELSLRSQVTMYSERYQEFQSAIQQSSQMVSSCHTEIEKMGKRIKKLEKERNDFRHRWEIAEQNQRKASEEFKLMEKEKRQLETKLERLDKLSRALQQERADLQTSIKTLSSPSTSAPLPATQQPTLTEAATNGNGASKIDADSLPTSDAPPASLTAGSPNLYDSELGRIAKTVD